MSQRTKIEHHYLDWHLDTYFEKYKLGHRNASKLFLEENGYASHEEWLKEWTAARSSEFFCLGSKDETAGNQSCVATVASDGNIALRLRLPNAFVKEDKYLLLQDLVFDYGHKQILQALSAKQACHIATAYGGATAMYAFGAEPGESTNS